MEREKNRKEERPTSELRLRYSSIAAFGLLFFLSYGIILLMAYGDPYTQGLVNAGLDNMAPQVGTALLMATLGVLMLLSVFKRRVFHVFAGFVFVYKLCVTIVSASVLRNIDLFSGNNMALMPLDNALSLGAFANLLIPRIADLILWCLPFAVYYLLLVLQARRKKQHR
jgi:hypothetical protein